MVMVTLLIKYFTLVLLTTRSNRFAPLATLPTSRYTGDNYVINNDKVGK